MSINKFLFSGNLTRDCELHRASSGSAVATLSLAVNRAWTGTDGARRENTNFFRIKCFDRTAENAAKYLGKGSKLFIEGRIENTEFEKDGRTVYGFDFVADYIEYLDTKQPAGVA